MSDEELMRIAFADKRTVQEILRHIFELGENKGRAEAIEEVLTQINEITTFYCGDKEGNSITPKMIVKDEVIKVIEQLKEKQNVRP